MGHDDWSAKLPAQGSAHIIAIDVPNLFHRAWHGHVNAKRHEPERVAPTTLGTIARILRGRQPTHAVFAGEGVGSVRAELYAGYKAGRPEKPDGFALAESSFLTALASADITLTRAAGLEGDDVLHAAAIVARASALPCVLVTNDRDAEQLVRDAPSIVVWDGRERVLDVDDVQARWEVAPERLLDLFSVAGQDGDGIPGVRGWGPKIAAKVLASSSKRLAELLLAGGHWFVGTKYRAKFLENVETIALSYELVRLRGEGIACRMSLLEHEINPLLAAERLAEEADRLSRTRREYS